MPCFVSTRSQNTEFWPILLKKNKKQHFKFLTKNHGLTPLEKCKIFTFLNRCFYSLKWLVYYLESHKHFLLAYFAEKLKRTKFPIFGQN